MGGKPAPVPQCPNIHQKSNVNYLANKPETRQEEPSYQTKHLEFGIASLTTDNSLVKSYHFVVGSW
jgi:hypothetical protein